MTKEYTERENYLAGVETLAKCLYSDDYHLLQVYEQINYLKNNFIENDIDILTINKFIDGVIAYLRNEKEKKNLFYIASSENDKMKCANYIHEVNTKIDFIINTLTNMQLLDWKIEINPAPKKALTPDAPVTKKKKIKPNPETIESIFNNIKNIKEVIDILIDNEVLAENGTLAEKRFHILAITEALYKKGIINCNKKTIRNKLFAKLFKVEIADKTATSENEYFHDKKVTDYSEMFCRLS